MEPAPKIIVVSAGIIRKGDRFLIAQRKADSFLEASKWEFPGGKVEFGEHPEETIIREIKEEIGIEITVDKLYTLISHVYKKEGKQIHMIMLAFLADWVSGEAEPLECQEVQWVHLQEMMEFDWVIADVAIVEKLVAEFSRE